MWVLMQRMGSPGAAQKPAEGVPSLKDYVTGIKP